MLSSAFTNSEFLQIIPVILKSGETCIRANALLDTDSDAILVRSNIVNYLKLDGVTQNLKIANAILNQKPLQSKLVSFGIYSDSQPDPFTITNAWVVPKLHPGDVTLITGTDFPKLLLNEECKEGKYFEPYAIKTYLACVLIGGNKRLNTSVNSNLT